MTDPVPIYSWRRRSLTTEHAATITLARWTAWPERCPGCGSHTAPIRTPVPRGVALRIPCPHPWHEPTSDLLLVVDSPQDRRRLFLLDGTDLPHGLDFEEVEPDDEHVTPALLRDIEGSLGSEGHLYALRIDGKIERLWGAP